MLWQCAYTEFYFPEIYWPDFDEQQFAQALKSYQTRKRRFGYISEQLIGVEGIA